MAEVGDKSENYIKGHFLIMNYCCITAVRIKMWYFSGWKDLTRGQPSSINSRLSMFIIYVNDLVKGAEYKVYKFAKYMKWESML